MSNATTKPVPTALDLEIGGSVHQYPGADRANLSAYCVARGVYPGVIRSLGPLLEKSLHQPFVYDGYTSSDLEHFLFVRGLEVDEDLTLRWRRAETDQLRAEQKTTKARTKKAKKIQKMLKTKKVKALQNGTQEEHQVAKSQHLISKNSPAPRRLTPRRKRQVKRLISQYKRIAIRTLEAADRENKFDFLGLPAELRLKIYHLACRASGTIMYPRQPAITKVCRLVRTEALPVYYGFNRFGVLIAHPNIDAGNPWLASIQSSNLVCVRSFEFVLMGTSSSLEIDFGIHGQRFNVTRRRRVTSIYVGQWDVPDPGDIRYARFRQLWHREIINETMRGYTARRQQRETDDSVFRSQIESVLVSGSYSSRRRLNKEFRLSQGFSASSVKLIAAALWYRL